MSYPCKKTQSIQRLSEWKLAKVAASGITQAQWHNHKHNLHKSHGHIKAFYLILFIQVPINTSSLIPISRWTQNSPQPNPQRLALAKMSTQPYSEPQIIALITQYYHLLVTLSYVTPSCIDFPPPSGREIPTSLCTSLNLTPQAISLMRHIPCPIDEHVMLDNEFFLPNSLGNSFCSERLIKLGRDPEIAGEREGWLEGRDVAISIMGDEGGCVVVDTVKSKIIPALFELFASWVPLGEC
jgi:hypothetical protein